MIAFFFDLKCVLRPFSKLNNKLQLDKENIVWSSAQL